MTEFDYVLNAMIKAARRAHVQYYHKELSTNISDRIKEVLDEVLDMVPREDEDPAIYELLIDSLRLSWKLALRFEKKKDNSDAICEQIANQMNLIKDDHKKG